MEMVDQLHSTPTFLFSQERILPCRELNPGRHYSDRAIHVHLIQVHFNIIIPCTPPSSQWSLIFRLSG
jgi:hypothetical protein